MRFVLALVLLVTALAVTGCGSQEETKGYDKANFEKKPMPEGFGPGGGASATPPANTGQ